MCGLMSLTFRERDKSLRDGEVVGLSWPRGCFVRPRCGREGGVLFVSISHVLLSRVFCPYSVRILFFFTKYSILLTRMKCIEYL